MKRLDFFPQIGLYSYTQSVGQPFNHDFDIPFNIFGNLNDYRCLMYFGESLQLYYNSNPTY
jgi:hypothetical protein